MGNYRLWKVIFVLLMSLGTAFSGSPDRHWQYYSLVKKQLSKTDKHILIIDEQAYSTVASFILIENERQVIVGEISINNSTINKIKHLSHKNNISQLAERAMSQIEISSFFKAPMYVDTPLYSVFRSDGYYFQYYMFTENQKKFCKQLLKLEKSLAAL